MHVRRETTAAAIVVSVLVCSPCGKAEAQRAPEGVTVAFQTRASAVQYEPILIDLVIVNRLNEPVNFDLGGGWREHLKVDVMRPDGTSIDVPRRVIAGVARRGDITLAAGRMIREQYVLDEWVTLQEPGAYQLKISVQSTFGTASGNVVTPSTTQIMEVHIAPYDEARLRQVCEWLANRAITEPVENPASEDAAVALSHIDHPIAVPYLRRVARQAVSVPEGLIVQALLRIGTVDARDALVEMLQSTDPLVVQNVVDALQRFELRQR